MSAAAPRPSSQPKGGSGRRAIRIAPTVPKHTSSAAVTSGSLRSSAPTESVRSTQIAAIAAPTDNTSSAADIPVAWRFEKEGTVVSML